MKMRRKCNEYNRIFCVFDRLCVCSSAEVVAPDIRLSFYSWSWKTFHYSSHSPSLVYFPFDPLQKRTIVQKHRKLWNKKKVNNSSGEYKDYMDREKKLETDRIKYRIEAIVHETEECFVPIMKWCISTSFNYLRFDTHYYIHSELS